MKKAILVLLLSTFMAAPVLADLSVVIDASFTDLTITDKKSASVFGASIGADDNFSHSLQISIQDDNGNVTDGPADMTDIDTYLDFTLSFSGSGDIYSASGSFAIADINGGNGAIDAAFNSTNIHIATNTLFIEGSLSRQTANSSILLGGDPWWTYQGLTDSATLASDPENYDGGTLVTLNFALPQIRNVSDPTLQDLFGYLKIGDSIGNGSLHAEIVPVPAAVLLGFLGLGAAGLKLRKFA